MKKFLLVTCLIICFGAFCFAVVPQKQTSSMAVVSAAEVSTTNPELNEETEESSFFREKVAPFLIANISGIFSAIIVIATTLGKIKAATTELKASNAENTYLKKKVKKLEEDNEYLKAEVASIKKTTTDTKEMVKIGFCNMGELVTNGFAEEIAKVGENEEESKS